MNRFGLAQHTQGSLMQPQAHNTTSFPIFLAAIPSPGGTSSSAQTVTYPNTPYVEASLAGPAFNPLNAPLPPSGPVIASPADDESEEDKARRKAAKKEKGAQRKRKRKPETMTEFVHSLNWPTQTERDEITSLLVEKNNLELSDIMDVPDDLLLNELARAGVGKMGYRMKILNGRKQFLPKKRKASEHPRTGPDGEPLSAVATSRTRKLAMHRLEIAHDRYAAVKSLLASGKSASVHAALDQLDIKKSTFFDCKYVTELKIIDEAKYNEIKAEMLEKRKTAKDFNTACYNYLKELKRKGVRIDESKRAQLLPNSY